MDRLSPDFALFGAALFFFFVFVAPAVLVTEAPLGGSMIGGLSGLGAPPCTAMAAYISRSVLS